MGDWKLLHFDDIPSTNELAKELVLKSEISYNSVIYADSQSSGKGRYDRKWHSPKGNLYCSFVVENKNPSCYSFVSALSVLDSFFELGLKKGTSCKWPNDVLIDGKKSSGILLEVCESALIIGIGINIISSFLNSKYETCSLSDYGIEISPQQLLEVLSNNLSSNIKILNDKGFALIREKWLNYAHNLDSQIEVTTINEKMVGIFKGISEQGALLLDTGKETKQIMAGDVFYL